MVIVCDMICSLILLDVARHCLPIALMVGSAHPTKEFANIALMVGGAHPTKEFVNSVIHAPE